MGKDLRSRGEAAPQLFAVRLLQGAPHRGAVFLKARCTATICTPARTRHQQHRLRHTHGLLYNRPKDTNTAHPYRKEYCIFGAGFDFAPAFPTANSPWNGALPPTTRTQPRQRAHLFFQEPSAFPPLQQVCWWRPSVRAAGARSSSVVNGRVSRPSGFFG